MSGEGNACRRRQHAVKWVVEEQGTPAATSLRSKFHFAAPGLLATECANILWKKVRRGDLTRDEAIVAARLLERSGIDLLPVRDLTEQATALAVALDHPAYDCVYLCMARQRKLRFVTADERLLGVVRQRGSKELSGLCVALDQIGAPGAAI